MCIAWAPSLRRAVHQSEQANTACDTVSEGEPGALLQHFAARTAQPTQTSALPLQIDEKGAPCKVDKGGKGGRQWGEASLSGSA